MAFPNWQEAGEGFKGLRHVENTRETHTPVMESKWERVGSGAWPYWGRAPFIYYATEDLRHVEPRVRYSPVVAADAEKSRVGSPLWPGWHYAQHNARQLILTETRESSQPIVTPTQMFPAWGQAPVLMNRLHHVEPHVTHQPIISYMPATNDVRYLPPPNALPHRVIPSSYYNNNNINYNNSIINNTSNNGSVGANIKQ